MTREELLQKISEDGGTLLRNEIEFTIDEEKTIVAKNKKEGEWEFTILLWTALSHEYPNAYSGSNCLEYIARFQEFYDFLVRYYDAIEVESANGILSVAVVTKTVEEKIVEKEVSKIPEDVSVRLREADKLEGKTEAYEKLLIGRKIQIDA